MTLAEILAQWRRRLVDVVKPNEWTDAEGVLYANAAVREACERALLIEDDDTDNEICNIDGIADTATYDLDPRIFEVRAATWGGHQLKPIARETLNSHELYGDRYGAYFYRDGATGNVNWKVLRGTPRFFLVPQSKTLTLVRIPIVAAPIHLSVYRYPLNPLTLQEPDGEPEIPERYHLHLIDWMEHLAYDNVDAEKGDPDRSAAKAKTFTENFGPRLDANTQRSRLEKRSHRTRMNPDW